ncbi:MAG: hypothetical protein JNG89_03115, partial [Planctomycetaceae bacterium]|nr:hypothetical protein [Planctomycetaceae bacterium]
MIRVALRRNAAGLVVPILLLALAARLAGVANAQDAPESGATAAADSQSTVRLSVVTNSRLGQLTYVPEQWGELQLRLDNTGATARDVLCSSYFNDDQTLQYARQVWLPPRSRLAISTPALVPQADRFPSNSGRIQSLMIDRSQGSEVLLASDSGKLRQEQPVLVAPEARHTGIIAGWETGDEVPVDAVNLIVASRVAQSLNNRLTVLTGHFLPSDEISLRYLDHLVIAENRLLDDPAAMDAVRRWLHGGGRLWIMLDRVDPLILERLLGDDFQGHLVERVSLTSIRIDKAPSFSAPNGEDGEVHEYEEPVDMARVAVSGIKVWNTVDGWPVAMSCSSGEGRVLITTLGARAWYGPAQPNKESKVKPLSDFAPLPPMVDLTAYVLATRDEPPLPQSTLQPIAQEYVSYTVPTWSLVVGTMGVFLALLFATGFWLWRRERLEHFGWTGSLLAVVFGMALTGIGMANHYGVPDAISSVQVVQAVSGTDDVTTHGVVGVYRSEGSQAPIQATLGGRLWPELAVEGETRRMVTTDLGEFTWEGVTQPAGLRMYSGVTAAAYPARIAAQGTVDAAGVVGRYEGCAAAGTEAVLATQYGRMAVTLSADGQFSAATGGILDKDEFLKATFVGDVQDRRRRLLQDLFKNRGWIDSLDRPQLLLWLDGWEHGFQF